MLRLYVWFPTCTHFEIQGVCMSCAIHWSMQAIDLAAPTSVQQLVACANVDRSCTIDQRLCTTERSCSLTFAALHRQGSVTSWARSGRKNTYYPSFLVLTAVKSAHLLSRDLRNLRKAEYSWQVKFRIILHAYSTFRILPYPSITVIKCKKNATLYASLMTSDTSKTAKITKKNEITHQHIA